LSPCATSPAVWRSIAWLPGPKFQERNKKLPAQKAGGRYKGNPYNRDMVL